MGCFCPTGLTLRQTFAFEAERRETLRQTLPRAAEPANGEARKRDLQVLASVVFQ